ncbi:MAG: 2-pyrone-4,6-dicarboxylate hydrolase [Rhodospirillaceae bacterium]|nr:2-pyrone-4,6-dicarboxylate hydrolase [Rhodospirillaceae bacterium]|tara:strand:+ start:1950 stop:2846 length:897 start_codon:yes stop_codon:yes gene_type:complete
MPNDLPYALPPDPNTKPPSFEMPDKACDTHFHIFGPPDRFPFSETRRYTPPGGPFEHYRNVQEITGLTRGIAVQPTAHGMDNSAILDAVERSEGNMRAVVRFNDQTTDEELEALHEAGARGARFSLMSDRPGSAEMIKHALPRMEKLGWSLVLHVETDHFIDNEAFIRGIPIPTVIDHMARCRPADGIDQPGFRLMLDLLKDDRFWVKICSVDKISAIPQARVESGLPFSDVIPLGQAVIDLAPDRTIWGTDWPHGNTFTPGRIPNEGDLLDIIAAMAGDQNQLHKILVENPDRLYFS